MEGEGQQTAVHSVDDVVENMLRELPMLHILGRMRGGRLLDQMKVELAEVVREAVTNKDGKAAELVLTLKAEKPSPKLNLKGQSVIISAQLKKKLPSDPPEGALFYFNDEGGLHMQDPSQKPLAFTDTGK